MQVGDNDSCISSDTFLYEASLTEVGCGAKKMSSEGTLNYLFEKTSWFRHIAPLFSIVMIVPPGVVTEHRRLWRVV
jgi:hypothetical protein